MTNETAKKNQQFVPVILWAALVMTTFFYLGMTFLIPRGGEVPSNSVFQTSETSTETSQETSVEPAKEPMQKVLYPVGLAMALAGLALGHARSLWKDAQSAMKFHIISLALCESCALIGFIIFMDGKGDPTEPRSMMIMAAVCMATLFPTPKRMHLAQA